MTKSAENYRFGHKKLRIWSQLLEKSLMKSFIFCKFKDTNCISYIPEVYLEAVNCIRQRRCSTEF